MNFYDRFLTRRALRFANQIRATHGLPPATRMERGMLSRMGECPLARTIGPTIEGRQVQVGNVCAEGWQVCLDYQPRYALPAAVTRFVKRFDLQKIPHLWTARPLPRLSPSIDHLDFPVEDERVAA